MSTNLEIAGAIKRTQKGSADWYYGGDNEAWPDIATAQQNIPAAVRPGKTIGVYIANNIAEYWWPTAAIADNDLVIKLPVITSDPQPVHGSNLPVQSGGVADAIAASINTAKLYADTQVVSVYKDCGNWDASTGNFPTTGGTGTNGTIKAGNAFEVSIAGNMGGEPFDVGDIFRALTDTPNQTLANWARSEHNTQQATETNRGTVKIASQTEIQNQSTTDNISAITPQKFWQGIDTVNSIPSNISGAKNFTGALQNHGSDVEIKNNKNQPNGYPALNNSGVVDISQGGTGSSTKTFVDLSTNQTINGNKSFTGLTSNIATTPEQRFITSEDSAYARFQRTSVTNKNSFIAKNQVVQVGGVGKCISLKSSANQYLSNLPTFPYLNNWSISFWAKSTNMAYLFSLGHWGDATNQIAFNYLSPTSSVLNYGFSRDGGQITTNTGVVISDDNWHHIVITITESTGQLANIYIDNNQVLFNGDISYGVNTALNFQIGRDINPNGIYYFNGSLDQFLIYNTALTSTQVSELYNSGQGTSMPPLSDTNLILRYEFDEGVGTITADTNTLVPQTTATLLNSIAWDNNGITPITANSSESVFFNISDGLSNSERGIATWGDYNGRNQQVGKWFQFFQNNAYPLVSDNFGKFMFNPNNTNSGYVELLNSLNVIGTVYIGDTPVLAPSNGLIVQGHTLIGKTIDDGINTLQVGGSVGVTNLAGNGNALLQTDNNGNISASYKAISPIETDLDVIQAIVDITNTYNDGYTASNNFISSLSPVNSKDFQNGKIYIAGRYLYMAIGTNLSLRLQTS